MASPTRGIGRGAALITASDGYFEAMHIPLVRGRYFDSRDAATAPPVVIVDQRLARRFWPGRDAIGRGSPSPATPRHSRSPDTGSRHALSDRCRRRRNVQLTGLTPKDPPVGAFLSSVRAAARAYDDGGPQKRSGSRHAVPALRSTLASIDRELRCST
jgi:hypothetical protein